MRKLANRLFKPYLQFRLRHIRRYMQHPHEVQREWLDRLLLTAKAAPRGR